MFTGNPITPRPLQSVPNDNQSDSVPLFEICEQGMIIARTHLNRPV